MRSRCGQGKGTEGIQAQNAERRPQGGVAGQSLQKAEPSQGREHREERERERRERMQRCPTRQVHRVEITDCRTISAEAHPYCVRIKRNPLL